MYLQRISSQIVAFFTIAALALCLITAAADAQQTDDKGFLTSLLEDNLSSSDSKVSIVGFQGAFSTRATVEELKISDREGTWLTMRGLSLDWDRSALVLEQKLIIQELSVSAIEILRKPLPSRLPPTAEATPLAIPELPIEVDIGNLTVDTLYLGAPVIGTPVTLGISGAAELAGKHLEAEFEAHRTDGKSGFLKADILQKDGQLALDVMLDEPPGGIAARVFNLRGAPAVTASLQGEGPLDEFRGRFNLALNGLDEVAGQLVLRNLDQSRQIGVDLAGDFRPFAPERMETFFGPASLLSITVERSDTRFSVRNLLLRTQSATMSGRAEVLKSGWPLQAKLSGSIQGQDGTLVALPLPGPPTYIQNSKMEISFDHAVSDQWHAQMSLQDLEREDLELDVLTLDYSGTLKPPLDAAQSDGIFTLNGTYQAVGLVDPFSQDSKTHSTMAHRTIWGELRADTKSQAPLHIRRLSIESPDIQAELSGQIARADQDYKLDLEGRMESSALRVLAPFIGRPIDGAATAKTEISFGPLTRSLSLSLEAQGQDVELDLLTDPLLKGPSTFKLVADRDRTGTRVHQFDLKTNHTRISGSADLNNTDAEASFSLDIPDGTVLAREFQGSVRVNTQIIRRNAGNSILTLTGTLPDATIEGEATLAPRSAAYQGKASLTTTFRDLSPYSWIAGRDLSGRGSMRLTGTGNLAYGTFDLDLRAAANDLQVGVDKLDQLLSGASTLEGRARRSETGEISLSRLLMLTEHMKADAQGTWDEGLIGEAHVHIPEAARIGIGSKEPIDLALTSRPDSGRSHIEATLAAPDMQAQLDGTLSRALPSTPERVFDLAGSAQITNLSTYSNIIGTPISGGAALDITGRLNPDRQSNIVQLSVTSADIDLPVARQATNLLAPPLKASVQIKHDTDDLSFEALRLETAHLDASGTARRQGGAWSGIGAVNVDDVRNASTALYHSDLRGPILLDIEASPTDDSTSIKVTGRAPQLTLTGRARLGSMERNFDDLRFDIAAQSPNFGPYASVLSGIQTLYGGAQVSVTGHMSGEHLSTDLRATLLNLATGTQALDALLGTQSTARMKLEYDPLSQWSLKDSLFSSGAISLAAQGGFNEAGLQLAPVSAQIEDLSLLHPALEGRATARGRILQNESRSTVDLKVTSTNGLDLDIKGESIGGQPNFMARGRARLGMINGFIAPQALSGNADLDLRLSGFDVNSLSGTIRTRGSRLAVPEFYAALNNLTGTISVQNGAARAELSARDQSGGRLSAQGTLKLDTALTTAINLTFSDVLLRDPALYETSLNGALSLNGGWRDNTARITGDVRLPRIEIKVPTQSIGGLGPLPEVRHQGASAALTSSLRRAGLTPAGVDILRGGNSQTGEGAREKRAIPLDIDVRAPNRIFVRGRGVDAEFGGQMTLRGTTLDVVPAGRLELIRGRLTILQQRFDFEDGYAALEGDFTPFIHLSAVTELPDLTAFIEIDGDISEPTIKFSSAPSLPEDEVLARLIFGQNLQDISPLQAVQLASALNTLAGGNEIGIVSAFREKMGLDDLDLVTNQDGQAELRAGKYINEKTYVETAVDTEGHSEITLNLDLSDELELKGSTDSDGESTIGIFFERDY